MAILQLRYPQGAVEIRGDFFPSCSQNREPYWVNPWETFSFHLKLSHFKLSLNWNVPFSTSYYWAGFLPGAVGNSVEIYTLQGLSPPPPSFSFLSAVANATIVGILGGYWSLNKLYVCDSKKQLGPALPPAWPDWSPRTQGGNLESSPWSQGWQTQWLFVLQIKATLFKAAVVQWISSCLPN